MARFFAIPTTAGLRKIANATLLGEKVNVVEFAVGDGAGSYYAPSADQTELRNETWRTDLSHGETDPDKPNVLNFYAVMPYNVGGFTIREMAVVDAMGDLIGVANTPDIEKVAFEDGVTNDMLLTISLAIESPETLEFKVDPNVVVASQADIARHNTSTEAHVDIRKLAADVQAAVESAASEAASALAEHNDSEGAHPKIQAVLEEHEASLANKANLGGSTEIVLLLPDGFTSYDDRPSIYWKNEFGEVFVCLDGATATGSLTSAATVAQLPAGFRPKDRRYFPITGWTGSERVACTGAVLPTGEVRVVPSSPITDFHGNCFYIVSSME